MICCDIETLDFFADPHIKALPRDQQLRVMRFGCAVTYNEAADEWLEWQAHDVADLYVYLGYMPKAAITGWNIKDFDWLVICNNAMIINPALRPCNPELYDPFDLIRQKTERWYSLESIAQHNLGRGKLADGQKAAEWLRSGDAALVAKALEYCRHDVQLTMDLAAILKRGEPLRLPPRAQRQELNEVLIWNDGRTERIPDATGAVSTK